MPSASPMVAGECWPAVKMPSTSETLRPASRTALVTASTCSESGLLVGRRPAGASALPARWCWPRGRGPADWPWCSLPRRLEERQRDLVGHLLEDDRHRHVAL